ncbi:metallophosphoesterase [Sphingosinicella sp. CPCC 101087]|uniref:metallophosphoesterase n=1 Tax=Sphingosinicella sp. CPCC 101087 TaxID=2497754 RepID=UPI00101D5FAA|nr:metallophosphoesterase [Sphingosinicella sp. CPCC 101087]
MTLYRSFLFLLLVGLALLAWSYRTAVSDPIVREAEVALAGWPPGVPPVRALLVSDIHVAGPDMPPSRLERIVEQINGLRPDLVLIAGDLVSDKLWSTRAYTLTEAVEPLARLRPRLGVFAVLGNHDHWRDAGEARRALEAAGIAVLDNEAARAGPLVIGGLDDAFTGRHDMPATMTAMERMEGPGLLLSHSPDPFPSVPPATGLMLAGHTHCGQIRLPLVGALSTMSEHGDRYACGRIDEAGKSLIVTAGIGTSLLPLRLGARPDMWLVEIGPERLRPHGR